MGSKVKEMAVVSKMFCSSSQVVLGVRTRVQGVGFVVSDMHSHQVMFRVDGCGALGKKDQMTLKDAYQTPLLLICRKIKGYFPDRDCSIVDSRGNIIAQVGVDKEMKQAMEKKDVYHVVLKPGIDQAFVVGVIAILDYIHNGSTRC